MGQESDQNRSIFGELAVFGNDQVHLADIEQFLDVDGGEILWSHWIWQLV